MPDTRMLRLLNDYKVAVVSTQDYERTKDYGWFLHKGYAAADVDGKLVYLHRLVTSAPTAQMVDHINGDRLDNRRENLRQATNAQNQANVSKRPGTTSRFKGVSWHASSGKWQARTSINGKQKHLGYFTDEAVTCYP